MSTPKVTLPVHQYRVDICGSIGKGKFGSVHRAWDPQGHLVAAKRIDGLDNQKGIQNESFQYLLRLDHPNLVRILHIERSPETIWMVMEYCWGDLNKFFREHSPTLQHKLLIMRGMARAVEYLHGERIIHRDIKPGNVLVAPQHPPVVKLADFDLSKFLDPEVETSVMSSVVSTEAFRAPEFWDRNRQGELRYHCQVDVFAAGLTFLAMLQHNPSWGRCLTPHIETAKDDSEKYQSIGALLVERHKYQIIRSARRAGGDGAGGAGVAGDQTSHPPDDQVLPDKPRQRRGRGPESRTDFVSAANDSGFRFPNATSLSSASGGWGYPNPGYSSAYYSDDSDDDYWYDSDPTPNQRAGGGDVSNSSGRANQPEAVKNQDGGGDAPSDDKDHRYSSWPTSDVQNDSYSSDSNDGNSDGENRDDYEAEDEQPEAGSDDSDEQHSDDDQDHFEDMDDGCQDEHGDDDDDPEDYDDGDDGCDDDHDGFDDDGDGGDFDDDDYDSAD